MDDFDAKLDEIEELKRRVDKIPELETTVTNLEKRLEEMITDRVKKELQVASLQGWSYDPMEQRFCVCDQVSHGKMIACSSTACSVKWFHFSCVRCCGQLVLWGLSVRLYLLLPRVTTAPRGKWLCPPCRGSRR